MDGCDIVLGAASLFKIIELLKAIAYTLAVMTGILFAYAAWSIWGLRKDKNPVRIRVIR